MFTVNTCFAGDGQAGGTGGKPQHCFDSDTCEHRGGPLTMDTPKSVADEAPWFDSRWTRRVAIRFSHKLISGTEDLLDFPAYIERKPGALVGSQPSGFDLLFTAGDGVTKLCHEIREWNSETHALRAYVKVPRMSADHDTLIFLYFGNPAAPNQEDRAGVWKDYQFVGNPEKPAEHATRVLEALFDDPALARLRRKCADHPAVRNFDGLQDLVRGRRFDQFTWTSQAARIGVALLDTLDIQNVDPASTWELVAEPEALRQIRSRLADPEEFQDQFAVIRCWSLLHGMGITARLVERPGCPDISVDAPSGSTWIEVKRCRLGTRVTRVRKIISKANRQIRNASATDVGIVYLEVSRSLVAAPLTDDIPTDVDTCIGEVRRECGSGHSTSIGRVVVAWDDMAFLGRPPALTKAVFLRKTAVVDHKEPLSRPSIAFHSRAGRTVDFDIRWR
jgi:hypothetical protein